MESLDCIKRVSVRRSVLFKKKIWQVTCIVQGENLAGDLYCSKRKSDR